MKQQTPLGEIDTDYQCVMEKETPPKTLKALKLEIKGWHIKIPSTHLFITEDESVYVVIKRCGKVRDYASLKSLIEMVKKTQVVEWFSEP